MTDPESTTEAALAGIAADLANIRLRAAILREGATTSGDHRLTVILNLLHTHVHTAAIVAGRAAELVPHLPGHEALGGTEGEPR